MGIDKTYKFSGLTDKVINLAIKIHKTLGPGFIEKIYEKALAHEFIKHKIKHKRQKKISVKYDCVLLGDQRVDFIVEDKIILELKAVSEINNIHKAQIISYLKAAELEVGLILNFAKDKLEIKRIIC